MASTITDSGTARPCRTLSGIISADKRAFGPHDTLRCAGNQMRSLHAGAWPVVENRTILGMIRGPSPDWRAQRFGHDPEESFVSACMNDEVSHCYDDDDCAVVLQYMLDHHLRYIPVTDHEEHFVGIVGLEDILSALVPPDTDAIDMAR